MLGGEWRPPMPSVMFEGPGILLASLMGVPGMNVQLEQKGVGEEPEAKALRWTRVILFDSLKWPTPGEFLGMAYRPMPYLPWYYQDSSPVLYSANWFEVEYYSSGIVEEVIPEGDPAGIGNVGKTYKIRVKSEDVKAKSCDFGDYAVGDRVALMKKLDSQKNSMTWKDLGKFDQWVILPVTFY